MGSPTRTSLAVLGNDPHEFSNAIQDEPATACIPLLDLAGEVGGNGVNVLCVVDVVNGGGEICGDTLLLIIFGLADKYGVGMKVHSYGPVLASIVIDDVVDDTSVVAKEGIESNDCVARAVGMVTSVMMLRSLARTCGFG